MRGFFKSFFAALLALIAFTAIIVVVLVGKFSGFLCLKPELATKSVLFIDLAVLQGAGTGQPLQPGAEDHTMCPNIDLCVWYDMQKRHRH